MGIMIGHEFPEINVLQSKIFHILRCVNFLNPDCLSNSYELS